MLYETKKKDNNIVHDIRTYIYNNICIYIYVYIYIYIYMYQDICMGYMKNIFF